MSNLSLAKFPRLPNRLRRQANSVRNWKGNYGMQCSIKHILYIWQNNVFLSLSKYVIMYFQACEANYTFLYYSCIFFMPNLPACSACLQILGISPNSSVSWINIPLCGRPHGAISGWGVSCLVIVHPVSLLVSCTGSLSILPENLHPDGSDERDYKFHSTRTWNVFADGRNFRNDQIPCCMQGKLF